MRNSLNITAHAGCECISDDKLMSIEAGISFGANVAEVDVRFNKKGVLVMSHDEDPKKEYRDHSSLAEAFHLIVRNGNIAVNCDIKESETIPAVLELAAQMGISKRKLILTGSVTPPALEEDPAILRKASVWINIEECLRHFCKTGNEAVKPFRDLIMGETKADVLLAALAPHSASLMEAVMIGCRRWGVKVINMPYTESAVALIPRMKEKGIKASVWTVDEKEKLKKLFGLGTLNVTTRNVRLAVETRKGFGIPSP